MFKTISTVLKKNENPSIDDINKIKSFLFCRWLSNDPRTILASNQINIYHNIPMVCQYYMVKTKFAGEIKFIKYPSREKIEEEKRITYISKHFNITIAKAKEYIELMSKEELNRIVDMYTQYDLKRKKVKDEQ